jgi:hypothetical protein
MANKEYNGWMNYQSWNVAMWLSNTESLYRSMCRFMQTYDGSHGGSPYRAFIKKMRLTKTPDRVSYISNLLDYARLDEFMYEFSPEGTRV